MSEAETPNASSGEPPEADVRVFMRGVGSDRKFIVVNLGAAVAREVRFEVQSQPGKNTPLVRSEHERTFPVESLDPGDERALSAIITPGTGIEFTGILTWVEADGSSREPCAPCWDRPTSSTTQPDQDRTRGRVRQVGPPAPLRLISSPR